jgi:hypothetical protein
MKICFFSVLLSLSILGNAALAQSDCSAFFTMEKGAMWEINHYNKKGVLSSVSKQEVGVVEMLDGTWEAQIQQKVTDEKGTTMTEGNYRLKCKDGTVFFDVADVLNPEMKEGLGEMEMSITGDALQLPSRLSVGQTLPDGYTEIKAGPQGVTIMTLRFEMTNRKVELKETITVPAGKFECYKITYTLNTKTILPKTFTSAIWYSEKVGMVKSETYDKKGNLDSRSELARFKL